MHIDAAVPDSPTLRVEASLLLFPGTAFANHAWAGRLRGVPLPALPGEYVSVLEPGDRRTRAGICCWLARTANVVTVAGHRVSAPRQLFVELADLLT